MKAIYSEVPYLLIAQTSGLCYGQKTGGNEAGTACGGAGYNAVAGAGIQRYQLSAVRAFISLAIARKNRFTAGSGASSASVQKRSTVASRSGLPKAYSAFFWFIVIVLFSFDLIK